MAKPNKKVNGERGQSDGGAFQRQGWVIRAGSAGRLWAVWSIMMVVAAALLRFQFLQGLGTNAPYITFYPAVVVAALYGGWRAGFLTLALSAAVGIYFWVQPVHTFTIRNPTDWLLLVTFLTTTALISFVTEAMHRARARARAAMEREVAALAQREADERLRMALEQSQTGGWYLDLTDHTVLRTLKHDQIFGYESLLPEWTYEKFLEHVLPEDRAEVDRCFHTATATLSDWSCECRIRQKDGAARWIRTTGGHQRDEAGQARRMAGIVQDITERKQAEIALCRSNRALKVISECNQALVRATSETELLQQVCSLLVEHGGYRMAWVGFAGQDETKSVRPVAQAGCEEGYLDTLQITWADTERGRGPTGTSIRTDQPVIARNIPADPAYGPWRTAAVQRGYASSATLPLIASERAFGALMIYSAQPDAFDGDEMALLGELAGDLAYGIMALRTHAERERAEAALRESEAKFRAIIEASPVPYALNDERQNITYVNAAFVRTFGYKLADIPTLAEWWPQAYPDAEYRQWVATTWEARLEKAKQTGTPFEAVEVSLRCKDGTRRTALCGAAPLGETSKGVHLVALYDITERMRAEAALRESEARLRLALDAAHMGIFDWDVPSNRITWSRWHEELWGFKPGEFGGTYEAFAARVHPADLPGINAEVARCIAARETFTQEFRVVWPDGSVHWTVGVGEFAFDAEGKPARMRGVVNEITDRKRLETALHELTGRTLRLQDEERRRLARELHDTTAQNLAALNMNLAVLEQALPPEGERLRALLADCQNLTDRSAQEIRTLAYLLHPPLLEEFGLARAARDYAEGFGQRSGIRVELSLEEALGRLPEEMELSLFRVLQESLGNVHRHSGSAVVRIRLAREAGAVCLEIADEGRGLPGGAVTGASVVGVGIQGMRERLQQLGGRLELTSGLPGVRVRAMLPLQEAKL